MRLGELGAEAGEAAEIESTHRTRLRFNRTVPSLLQSVNYLSLSLLSTTSTKLMHNNRNKIGKGVKDKKDVDGGLTLAARASEL